VVDVDDADGLGVVGSTVASALDGASEGRKVVDASVGGIDGVAVGLKVGSDVVGALVVGWRVGISVGRSVVGCGVAGAVVGGCVGELVGVWLGSASVHKIKV
jgi:hypothetical protein